MSLMIREYLGYSSHASSGSNFQINLTEGLAGENTVSSNSLFVDIEGIHEGPTRNFTRYTKEALQSSIKSWTHPYPKPLIKHHNEKDGEIIGRINRVEYKTRDTLSGTHALLFNVNVPDKEGAEQVKDGRLLTTSIGVIAHDVRCSCCGYSIQDASGCPEHDRGEVYDGEYCYWDIYEMEAKELSYVVVPSDIYAKNVKIYEKKEAVKLAESLQSKVAGGKKKMEEKEILELQESVKTLQEENENLTTQLEAVKTEKEELATAKDEVIAEKDTIITQKDEIIAELEKVKEDIAAIQQKLEDKEEELKQEVELRESIETKLIELKESEKRELISTYTKLRKEAGKAELSEAAISTRSIDSLKDSIEDLKIEIKESKSSQTENIPSVIGNPSITESKEAIVKKEKTLSNIDLEEGLHSLFNGAASHFNKK